MLDNLDNSASGNVLPPKVTEITQPVAFPKVLTDWFHYSVIRSRSGLFSETVHLTPEMAKLFLANNDKNRNINPGHVRRLASEMAAGLWMLNGESIKIATNGQLADGQHRCEAVVESGVAVQTVVVFGVDYETRLTTDRNLAKTVGNYIRMQDVATKHVNNCAMVARFILAVDNKLELQTSAYDNITKSAVLHSYMKNKARIDEAVQWSADRRAPKGLGSVSFIAALDILFSRENPNARDFLEQYVSGANLAPDSVIFLLRQRFFREPRITMDKRLHLMRRGFRAWVKGEQLSYIPAAKKNIRGGRK